VTAEGVLLTVLMFFVLVSGHEWGHYHFAKRAGILVREFAIGFGPRLLSFKKGETRYTIRLLPLGGFVRMAGEDPEIVDIKDGQTVAVGLDEKGETVTRIYLDQLDSRRGALRGVVEQLDLERRLSITLDVDGDLKTFPVARDALLVFRGRETQIAPLDRQFGSKTVAQRSMAIFAGPMMNFILAFLLFVVFAYMSGVRVDHPDHLVLSSVSDQSPAAEAGLKPGDIVVSVDGVTIGADREGLIRLIRESPGREMTWVIRRGGELLETAVTPRSEQGIGVVGIGISYPTRTPTVSEAVVGAGETMWNATKQIAIGLKMLVMAQLSLDDMAGIVRITEMTGEAVSQGMNMYVFWAGILSLYLGIFNLLPFPALDGSRLIFLGIEALRGRPVDPRRESLVHFIGFAMLMVLMIVVTYNDILRLLNPKQ